MYVAASGTVSRWQFVSNVTAHFGDELLVLHIEGCDSVVGFKASLGKMIKIGKISQSMGDDDELEKLVRKIRSEVMAKPRNVDYKLSDYGHHKVIESTSATLRSLVSSLVSGGAITKPSLTLAQCIQQHVDGTSSNQTTLGLSVKLHHKHGNYDLYIASPNRTKATHNVVMQFTQHPAGIIETGNIGVMQLTIPRLKKHESSSLRLNHQAIQLEHYTGRSKLSPPLLQTKALSAEESQLQSAAVRFIQQRDAAWLSQVHQNDKPVEWGGSNAQQDPVMEVPGNTPKTLVVFGHMIDSPPAHPDTVMTTFVYLQRTLNAVGMQYTHVSVDLQLYHTACPVQ